MAGPPHHFGNHLDAHCTLWMGDLNKEWNGNFIADAFKSLGHEPNTVKMVTDKHTQQMAGYCFVEFLDPDGARNAMLNANGTIIKGSVPSCRFNLSFANDPKLPSIEFNLFVNNLNFDIDDADLYQVFGARYRSCRGAKVYRNKDGSSRGLGFVRFGDQTEQQMALVEMNNTIVRGKQMTLKLAAAKQRLPRSHIVQGIQPFLIQSDMEHQYHPRQREIPMEMPMQPMVPAEPEYAPIDYPDAEVANERYLADADVWWEELEESRWSTCITNASWSHDVLGQALYDARW